ncbi:nucleic acid binding protein [Anaeramoeba flamelloides]|uniref:Nucleic acid binding protein n=1 Tax=Anaeramoeba flamelloides TaxID=1746091 RepID=A0AAV7YCP5_9EUKA|nr:nucleic acid binding protein [Anaeramoeba flamelloides]KAJ6252053.1 nucleic acid binding protein [Anaeramoeba flamelloides]
MSKNTEKTVKKESEETKTENTKLYVGNISYSTTNENLQESFEEYGEVVEANVVMRGNRSLGFGFVEFKTIEECEKAIEGLHDTELEGRKIVVEISQNKTRKKPQYRRNENYNSNYNNRYYNDYNSYNNYDYGYQGYNDYYGGGYNNSYRPNYRRRRNYNQEERKLSETTVYVTNVPFQTTDEELKEAFSEYNPKSARVVMTKFGRSRGFGFVDFENEKDRDSALEMNEQEMGERTIYVKVAYEQPKREEEEENEKEEN